MNLRTVTFCLVSLLLVSFVYTKGLKITEIPTFPSDKADNKVNSPKINSDSHQTSNRNENSKDEKRNENVSEDKCQCEQEEEQKKPTPKNAFFPFLNLFNFMKKRIETEKILKLKKDFQFYKIKSSIKQQLDFFDQRFKNGQIFYVLVNTVTNEVEFNYEYITKEGNYAQLFGISNLKGSLKVISHNAISVTLRDPKIAEVNLESSAEAKSKSVPQKKESEDKKNILASVISKEFPNKLANQAPHKEESENPSKEAEGKEEDFEESSEEEIKDAQTDDSSQEERDSESDLVKEFMSMQKIQQKSAHQHQQKQKKSKNNKKIVPTIPQNKITISKLQQKKSTAEVKTQQIIIKKTAQNEKQDIEKNENNSGKQPIENQKSKIHLVEFVLNFLKNLNYRR